MTLAVSWPVRSGCRGSETQGRPWTWIGFWWSNKKFLRWPYSSSGNSSDPWPLSCWKSVPTSAHCHCYWWASQVNDTPNSSPYKPCCPNTLPRRLALPCNHYRQLPGKFCPSRPVGSSRAFFLSCPGAPFTVASTSDFISLSAGTSALSATSAVATAPGEMRFALLFVGSLFMSSQRIATESIRTFRLFTVTNSTYLI